MGKFADALEKLADQIVKEDAMTTSKSDKSSECCRIAGVECLRGINKNTCPDWKAAQPPPIASSD